MSQESSTYTQPGPDQVEAINTGTNYLMYSVFATSQALPADDEERAVLVNAALAAVESAGVTVRGWYDVAGLRADADLMVWWHAPEIDTVQAAYHALRASDLGAGLDPVWSVAGIHRPAEFNRAHVPAYLSGQDPQKYLCVYPFVRSYDWYLMDAGERSAMLREHGMAAKDYKDVLANTVSAFALGDYEWLLGFEAAELHRIVDLMRDLRDTRARLHVREEIPFYTGARVDLNEWARRQPLA